MIQRKDPDYISFTDAADLLVRRGLVGSMTPRGLRYIAIARNSSKLSTLERWPFGDEPGQEPYLIAGRTRMMRTARLLEYLEQFPPKGRGPAKGSRSSNS
jgi:hypothetical protein